ncbi:Dipeptide transport system permease protein DppB [bioreactor metagenome]|uniref:Dipeptide transport system permease protein DppB n=2 Tax=root TaxID=1 RepID=A0A652ZUA1_9SPIR|nr:Dipeptide transport system permease protein DppB [uncultured Spirochaetota bacterium]
MKKSQGVLRKLEVPMLRYIAKRIFMLVPVLIGVTFLVFALMYITPSDPAQMMLGANASPAAYAQMRTDMGLDKPFFVQYVRFLFGYKHPVFGYRGLVFGDLGRSYITNRYVFELILSSFPNTVLLATGALIMAILLGVPIGILSATRPYSFIDMIFTVLALLGASMPTFWVAMVLIYFFANKLGIFPAMSDPKQTISLILPMITLSLNSMAILMRMTRSSMLEVMEQDYIRTARVKGMDEKVVIRKHALRNALIPIITIAGLQFGALLSGAVLTEKIFAYPGIGSIMVDAIYLKDTPQILGSICFVAIVFTLVNLVVDILYGLVDPRVKETKRKPKIKHKKEGLNAVA